MTKYLTNLCLFLILFTTAACTPATTPTPEPTVEAASEDLTEMIVVGDIDADDPISKIERFLPLADYLAANLNSFGIGTGDVQIATDTNTMAEWLGSGEVHVYYDSLFPALQVSDASGAIPILRRWRDNSPTYHSVFFTLADSGVTSLDDLNGQIVGYDNATSTSGYLLPTAHLISNDYEVMEVTTANSSVDDDKVGYFFTNDDDNTIEMVLNGQLIAGVVDNLTYLDDIPEETREQLIILAETDPVPRQVVLVSPTLSEDVREALIVTMVNLTESEEGLAILDELKTDRFDEFEEGAEAALESFRPYYDIVLGVDE